MSLTSSEAAALLAARASAVIPGGVNSGQRRVPGLEELIIAATSGSTFTDGDGRTYTDYHAAFGPPLLGHNDPDVDAAAAAAGALRRADGNRRHQGRDRARRAPRRRRPLAREGAADLHGQRGDVPCPPPRAHGHRPAPRDQVPGLLPRLARLGGDERDLPGRARRHRGPALGRHAPRGRRGHDRVPVQRRRCGRARARRARRRRRRDHPRADPAQHRRGAAAARVPGAAPRARDASTAPFSSSTR